MSRVEDKRCVADPQVIGKGLRYTPSSEEIPMTLQIGLLGSDGVVLASDTLVVKTLSEDEDLQPVDPIHVHQHEDKVVLNATQKVALAWAGNKPSREFIHSILDAFEIAWGKDYPDLSDLCKAAWQQEEGSRQSVLIDCTLIVAKSGERGLYKATFSRGRMDILQKRENLMLSGVVAGHEANSACFITQRYLPKDELAPIRVLVRLAAHYIRMGAKINPHGIGGLSIHVCRGSGLFERLPETRISRLGRESKYLDELASNFFSMGLLSVRSLQKSQP